MNHAIHYRGAIADHRGSMLAGWAVCCSGDRAMKARRDGRHSFDPADVTCEACLKRMRSHVKYWSDPARTQAAIECFIRHTWPGHDPRDLGWILEDAAKAAASQA